MIHVSIKEAIIAEKYIITESRKRDFTEYGMMQDWLRLFNDVERNGGTCVHDCFFVLLFVFSI